MQDLIFRTIARQALYIIMAFSLFLMFRGHNLPGGGFIAGLGTAAAIVVQYLAFDLELVRRSLPVDYKYFIAAGLLLALGTGLGTALGNRLFMNHTFAYYHLPLIGEIELTTALLFDLGVYLVVIGATLTIIATIGEE
ncbi:MAG: Na(+)/H(+) antiporter subunit B [Clostridia bacterium]|nr:Na(+)/H(+) antiporter subunit B [Clostridia bacterium]